MCKCVHRPGRSTDRVSCTNTELKPCSMIEIRWNKYEVSLTSPVWTQIRRPSSEIKFRVVELKTPRFTTAILLLLIIFSSCAVSKAIRRQISCAALLAHSTKKRPFPRHVTRVSVSVCIGMRPGEPWNRLGANVYVPMEDRVQIPHGEHFWGGHALAILNYRDCAKMGVWRCSSYFWGFSSADFNGLLLDNSSVCIGRGYYPHLGLVSFAFVEKSKI